MSYMKKKKIKTKTLFAISFSMNDLRDLICASLPSSDKCHYEHDHCHFVVVLVVHRTQMDHLRFNKCCSQYSR